MPNAVDVGALGDLFGLLAGNASTSQPMSSMRTTCRASFASLRPLPAKTPAVAASDRRQ